jgi:hypothetical protein
VPTKRRKLSARPLGISAAAIEAWRAGDWLGLHRALSLRPWEPSPFDTIGELPPEDARPWRASWPRVAELRKALIEQAVPPGRRRP